MEQVTGADEDDADGMFCSSLARDECVMQLPLMLPESGTIFYTFIVQHYIRKGVCVYLAM